MDKEKTDLNSVVSRYTEVKDVTSQEYYFALASVHCFAWIQRFSHITDNYSTAVKVKMRCLGIGWS